MAEGRALEVGKYITKRLNNGTSLTKDHLVLQIETAGTVNLAETNTARAYGIAARSTQSRRHLIIGETRYLTGGELETGIAIFRSGLARLPVTPNNAAIKVGDMIMCAASGHVNKGTPGTPAEFARRVGWAEEDIPAGTGGFPGQDDILVALDIMGGSP